MREDKDRGYMDGVEAVHISFLCFSGKIPDKRETSSKKKVLDKIEQKESNQRDKKEDKGEKRDGNKKT